MLLVKNITHFYGKEKILSEIDLTVKQNSFTVITGESGSGKTTLLSIMSTLLTPTQGSIIYKDIDSSISQNKFRNEYIGFVFQFHYLIAHLNIYENIKLVTKKSKKEIMQTLNSLHIQELAYKYPSQVSGGQRQRAAIARAIINNPKYIFADEPTGNLDSKNSKVIFDILRSLHATLIVVTHDKSLIHNTDNIIQLKDGTIC
jgi:putative ABC transport system ATP-binding protein